jgi:hypothetical protein
MASIIGSAQGPPCRIGADCHERVLAARTAGFDREHCWGKLLEERHPLLASQLLAQNRRLGGIHPMKLKNVFRRIHSNSDNLFHGRSPSSQVNNDLILAQSMPSGAVHTNKNDDQTVAAAA